MKKNAYLCRHKSPDGGIGRRAGLKHQWGNPSRFDPGSGYKAGGGAIFPRLLLFQQFNNFNRTKQRNRMEAVPLFCSIALLVVIS